MISGRASGYQSSGIALGSLSLVNAGKLLKEDGWRTQLNSDPESKLREFSAFRFAQITEGQPVQFRKKNPYLKVPDFLHYARKRKLHIFFFSVYVNSTLNVKRMKNMI